MSHMQKQILYGRWVVIEGNQGTETIPFDLVSPKRAKPRFEDVRDYVESSSATSIEVVDGWGARLSAPGYLDSTSWTVHKTEDEARQSLAEMFDDE
jgi:hypothetical protein